MTLALLLDEQMPHTVAGGLRRARHDVSTISTVGPGADDAGVRALKRSDGRWLLTSDSDFGDLTHQRGVAAPPAVLYFRAHPVVAEAVLALALDALNQTHAGRFCVVARDDIRQRPLPVATNNARP